ncbi:Short-chain dehydrogenase sdnK [Lachnellula arida]|uniref:Short-chain dehydrogenase sdnK n=1 Tax=Lachnellula arida TaxID=1316785 RepID=A0A8T9BHD7_9HELO|nr:Short-chain dehydrogenase sdnK [Lachnellula arida]
MSDPKSMWHAARNPPADPTSLSFKGKAVLVTGANSGLGLAAAIKYAAQGASPLILGVRSQEKGEQAKQAIINASKCPADIFTILIIDLSSFESVRDFGKNLNEKVPRLHVAQLGGGVMKVDYELTGDQWESTLQINALSPALLGLLLLPKLQATASESPHGEPSHLSFVNSIAHLEVKPTDISPDQSLIERCNDSTKWDFQKQYFLVKLVAWFAMRAIADRSTREGRVIVNANCPGLCKTNMLHELPFAARTAMAATYFIMGRTSEQGARTMVSATGLGWESHGRFWTNDSYPPSSELLESEGADALYHKTSDEILGILRKHLGPDIV